MQVAYNKLGIKNARHTTISFLFLHSPSMKNLVAVAATSKFMIKVKSLK